MSDKALADELAACKVIDRDLDARVAVALYSDTGHADDRDNTRARLPSKSDDCAPGTYWISAFSGLSLRTAPEFTGDKLLRDIAVSALQASACRWCNDNGWYSSNSGGFAQDRPCDYCNPKGLPLSALRRTPAPVNAEQPEGVLEALQIAASMVDTPIARRKLNIDGNDERLVLIRSVLSPNPTAEQPAEPQPSVVERVRASLGPKFKHLADHVARELATDAAEAAWVGWEPEGVIPDLSGQQTQFVRAAFHAGFALASSRSSETELLREALGLDCAANENGVHSAMKQERDWFCPDCGMMLRRHTFTLASVKPKQFRDALATLTNGDG